MKNNWLSEHKKDIASQRGEDGIIEKIFIVLGVDHGWCVDVGAYGRTNSNTYNLIAKGWSGILIETDEERIQELKKVYSQNNAYYVHAHVEPEGTKSLDNLLKKTRLPKEFEMVSIDIDGNDYYIWESLKTYAPTVVAIEFNPVIKLDDYLQPINGKGGSSLSVLVKLGKSKGYELIATTSINAFFVKKSLFNKFGIKDNSTKELFTDSNDSYGRDTTKYGYTEQTTVVDVVKT